MLMRRILLAVCAAVLCACALPIKPGIDLTTRHDSLADPGKHWRVQLALAGEAKVSIEAVTIGAGTARAYISDTTDLVVRLLGPQREVLASAGVRQPLVEYVYRARQKSESKDDQVGALAQGPHGKRILSVATVTVFLPADPRAERIEVVAGREQASVVASYALR